MDHSPYQLVPLVQQSLLQKVFRQRVDTNAVREVNNLLATVPVEQLSKKHVDEIGKKYNIDLCKIFMLNLEEFYAVYLNNLISRQHSYYKENSNLHHLQNILGISQPAIDMLHTKIGAAWYEKEMLKCINNNRFSLQEQKLLNEFSKNVRLPVKTAEEISLTIRQKYMENLIQPVLLKKRLSADDEMKIKQAGRSLDMDIFSDAGICQQLNRFKMYWSLENESLPIVSTNDVLAKKEVCYFTLSNVQWFETRAARRGMQLLKLIETGTLYLTDKRVLLVCHGRSFNIKLDRIITLKETTSGIEIIKDTGKNPVLKMFQHEDVASLILKRLVKEMV
jgi:hypothetical protein